LLSKISTKTFCEEKEMKEYCLKCGSSFKALANECSPTTCYKDVNIPLQKCACDICICNTRTPKTICAQCRKGYHRTELKR